MKATTYQGRRIELTSIQELERVYSGSDGHLYIDDEQNNPSSVEFSGGDHFYFPDPLGDDCARVYATHLIRLKKANYYPSISLVPEYSEGCLFYEIRGRSVADGVVNSSMKKIVKFLDQLDHDRSRHD